MLKRLLKRMLPQFAKKLILRLLDRWQLLMVWFFSRSSFLSSLYYCFFSRQFGREHQSVLKGRLAYRRQQGMQDNSNTLLRRNIHRIEKGLIMQPRKAVFALDYIAQTVAAYEIASNNNDHCQDEFKWAGDVLTEYFDAVGTNLSTPKLIPELQQRFEQVRHDEHGDQQNIPYQFSTKIRADISPQDFMDLCTQRRSVRWFEPDPVPRELLEQAVSMASLAPSACNRQPYQFHISDDKTHSQRLIEIPLGTKGFAHNVPCTIVITADLANYPTERDRHLIYIDGSLAAMQLMLALETLGLSSCPINWPDIEATERKMVIALGLADTVRPIMLVAVGYGHDEGKIPYSHKKNPQQLIRYV